MEQWRRPVVFAMNGMLGLILFKVITKSFYQDTALVSLILGALICTIQIKWSFKYNLSEIKKISNHCSMFFNYINCILIAISNLIIPYFIYETGSTDYLDFLPMKLIISVSLITLFLLNIKYLLQFPQRINICSVH
jgi:hypothetical protein